MKRRIREPDRSARVIPLPSNLEPTNPPLTPPRRGARQQVLLPAREGMGVGSAVSSATSLRNLDSMASDLSPLQCMQRGSTLVA